MQETALAEVKTDLGLDDVPCRLEVLKDKYGLRVSFGRAPFADTASPQPVVDLQNLDADDVLP